METGGEGGGVLHNQSVFRFLRLDANNSCVQGEMAATGRGRREIVAMALKSKLATMIVDRVGAVSTRVVGVSYLMVEECASGMQAM